MIIYKITNHINGKIYIGQTVQFLMRRWNVHCYNSKNSGISNAIKKYGKENFTVKEIDGANSLSELNYLEQHYIFIYNSMSPNGYNLITGGNNKRFSEESKLKMRKPKSDETKEKYRLAQLGNKNAKGSIRSVETRLKISRYQIGKIGKKHTEESKLKMSVSQKNRTNRKPLGEEHKRKIGISSLGRKHTEEAKLKISLANRKKIY